MSNVLSEKPYVSERDPGRKVPKKITKKMPIPGFAGAFRPWPPKLIVKIHAHTGASRERFAFKKNSLGKK